MPVLGEVSRQEFYDVQRDGYERVMAACAALLRRFNILLQKIGKSLKHVYCRAFVAVGINLFWRFQQELWRPGSLDS